MKSSTILLACLFIFFIIFLETSFAGITNYGDKEIPKVQKLDEIAPDLFQSKNMFFSGQPNWDTLDWLKKQGVDLVINLRSESENNSFSETAFNEKDRVSDLGIKYISIPISGNDSYTKENLKKLADALNSNYTKVLIHCASCGRVSNFMIAYLVEYKGYKLSEAVDFGKQLKFTFPLENLLVKEIVWENE